MKTKRLPRFRRQEWFRFKRLGEKWRKPRGRDSKMRLRMSGKPPVVSIGYKSQQATRGTHPSGFSEVLVGNMRALEKIDAKRQAVRISSSVGKRERERILAKAKELNIRVLNPGVEAREAKREKKAGR